MAAAMSRRSSTWALGAVSGTCAVLARGTRTTVAKATRLALTRIRIRTSRGNGISNRLPLTAHAFQYDRPPHHASLDVQRSFKHRDRLPERLATERRGELQPGKRAVAQYEVAVEPAVQLGEHLRQRRPLERETTLGPAEHPADVDPVRHARTPVGREPAHVAALEHGPLPLVPPLHGRGEGARG